MIKIGVTGHRILMEQDKIVAGIDEALSRIGAINPAQPLTVISSLAEGADRLVAHAALKRPGVRLVVPLPLPQDDYMTDFPTEASKAEFLALLGQAAEVVELPAAATRNQAYEAAGLYMLNHSDVVLTIWDGRAAQGLGGTGGIVALARELGLLIAWVHAGNRKTGTLDPTSLGTVQGTVTYEGRW